MYAEKDSYGKTFKLYPPEFRRDAVELVVTSGKTCAEVASMLGVNESTLAHWVHDARAADPAVGERRDGSSKLKARIRELEMENEFLKTGRESSVHGYYEAWDGILHYNGKADGGEVSPGGSGGGSDTGDLPMPRYRVAIMKNGKKVWLPWMRGMFDEGGSADTYAGEAGVGIVDIEFEGGSLGPNGWFTKNSAT